MLKGMHVCCYCLLVQIDTHTQWNQICRRHNCTSGCNNPSSAVSTAATYTHYTLVSIYTLGINSKCTHKHKQTSLQPFCGRWLLCAQTRCAAVPESKPSGWPLWILHVSDQPKVRELGAPVVWLITPDPLNSEGEEKEGLLPLNCGYIQKKPLGNNEQRITYHNLS